MWDNLVELEKLDNFKGFQTTFEQTLRDWKKSRKHHGAERNGL